MTQDAIAPLAPLPLPGDIRSRFVDEVNGLRMHVLEAGDPADPAIVLLHGFPELAFSWRAVMPVLAAAGYYVVAPDQRGFGRTTGWDDRYDADLGSFRQLNLVTDLLALLSAMKIARIATLVGHDFGSVVAAWAALIRPDVFAAVVLMSAPFAGPPAIAARASTAGNLDAALAALDPPRRHYTQLRPAGAARFPARLLPREERRLRRQRPVRPRRGHAGSVRPAADLLRDAARQGHGRDRGGHGAVAERNRRLPLAAGGRSTPRSSPAPASRAA
jgi:pimeloyl-ACP methyl ester carboxylesterase